MFGSDATCRRRRRFREIAALVRWSALLTALAVLGIRPASAQMIDLNGNGMSDIWEWIYNAYGINPNADPDGDGFSNLQEAIAGTESVRFQFLSAHPDRRLYAPTNFSVTLPCAPGKHYQLQSVTALGSTNWVVETNLVAALGHQCDLDRARRPRR